MKKINLFLFILISMTTSLMGQFKGLGFPCYNNQYKLELTTKKSKITTCGDTVQLSVSCTGNPDVYWTDGYFGKSRVISSTGSYQAYAYDSIFNCVDTTAAVFVTLNDAYVQVYSETFVNPTRLCDGNSINLYAYAKASVKWNTGDTTNTIRVSKGGKYYVVSKSINGCVDTSEVLEVILNSVKKLTIKANSDTTVCFGDSVELELTTKSGFNSFFWNPFYNQTRKVKIGSSGNINVYALDSANGCGILSNTIQVKILMPSVETLCMVTVDSAAGKNKLIWSVTPDKRTAYYNIYRESNFAGEFDLIGNTDLKNAGSFLDTQANPKQRPFTYYIEAVDSCGNADEYSRYTAHTTLHLTANLGVNGENNLNWSDYIGIYPLNTYIIYRSNNSGKFTAIGSVAASVKSFSDLDPPSGKNRYYIGIKGRTACDTTGSNLMINSNMVAFGILSAPSISKNTIVISPNPANDRVTICLTTKTKNPICMYQVYNGSGQVVTVGPISSCVQLNTSNWKDGIYTFRTGNVTQRIVIQH